MPPHRHFATVYKADGRRIGGNVFSGNSEDVFQVNIAGVVALEHWKLGCKNSN